MASNKPEIVRWWERQALKEIEATVPKTSEYSAFDLELIGRTMAETIGWKSELTRAVATELGITFYVLGKVGRAMGALRDGRLPSDDTWFDIAVYTRMLQRTREKGGWPQ